MVQHQQLTRLCGNTQSANGVSLNGPTSEYIGAMVGTNRSVSARMVGARLRAAMSAAGTFPNGDTMGVRELARRMKWTDHTRLSRILGGKINKPKPDDIAAIGQAIGIAPETLDELVTMCRYDDGPQWTTLEGHDRAAQLRGLLAFEQRATDLCSIAPALIPGILQTPDYTAAIMRREGLPETEVGARVEERGGRSDVLIRRQNPTRFTALIGEGALTKLIGGPTVMLDQLQELMSWAGSGRPNIDIRVIPEATDWHAGLEGPYLLMQFDDEPPVVHLETRASGVFLDRPGDVAGYRRAVDTVRAVALDPAASYDLIEGIVNDLDRHTESEIVA